MKDKNIQYRNIAIDEDFKPSEHRAEPNGETIRVLEGYAAKWGVKSKLLRSDGEYFYEILTREAFDKPEILEGDTTYNKDHDDEYLIARTEAGTLSLTVDDVGLYFKATLTPGVSYAEDLYRNVLARNIKENSFAFIATPEDYSWSWDETEDVPVGTLNNIRRLLDVSSVVRPAYPETTLEARSVAIESCEDFMTSRKTEDPSIAPDDSLKLEGEARKRKLKLKNQK